MTDAPDGGATAAPDLVAARDRVRVELVRFVRALRAGGVAVPANAGTTATRALVEVGLDDRIRGRTALRASLVADPADFGTFDRLFEAFWPRLVAALDGEPSEPDSAGRPDPELDPLAQPGVGDLADPDENGTDSADDDRETDSWVAASLGATATDVGDEGDRDEVERSVYSPAGAAASVTGTAAVGAAGLEPSFRALTRALAGLEGRRWEPGGDRADVRRALRASSGTGGTVLSIPGRSRRDAGVRATLLVDVSRSVLDTVDRGFLVEFLRCAGREWRDARLFFFDEDLREVTDAFDADTATAALGALESAEAEWGGGTRIGDSLARLRETAPDAVDRRTAVFVVSDGLEMADVAELEREVAWLARRASRVFWLNPLAAAADYEPVARGMAAALPYLDGLFAFAGPADVAELARQLRRHGPGGRIGHEFDPRRRAAAESATRQRSVHTTHHP